MRLGLLIVTQGEAVLVDVDMVGRLARGIATAQVERQRWRDLEADLAEYGQRALGVAALQRVLAGH